VVSGVSLSEPGLFLGETFTVSVSDHSGALSVGAADGATVQGGGTAKLIISGSAAQVNAALATLQATEPKPGGDVLLFVGSDSVGADTVVQLPTTIAATPVIAAPSSAHIAVGQPSPPGQVAFYELTVAQNETMTLTLKDQTGLLSVSAIGGVTETGDGTTSLTLVGGADDFLDTLQTLTIEEPTGGTDVLTLSGSDSLGQQAPTVTEDILATGQPVVGAPTSAAVVLGGSSALPLTLAEAGATAGETFQVSLADSSGLLGATSAAGATVSGGETTSLVVSGGLAAVNAVLASLTVSEAASGLDDLVVNAEDSFGVLGATFGVSIQPVASPVITTPAMLQTIAGTPSPLGASLSQVGATTTETFDVQVQDGGGTLSASNYFGADVIGDGGTSLTIAGTLDEVNLALSSLSVDEATAGGDGLQLSVTDSYGLAASPADVAITAVGPPTITAPAAFTVGAGIESPITGLALAEVGGPPAETFTVQVSDQSGRLDVVAGGGASVTGAGTANLVVSGTLAQVDAALAGLEDDDAASADTLRLIASDSLGQAQSILVRLTTKPTVSISAPATVGLAAGRTTEIEYVELTLAGVPNGDLITATAADTSGLVSTYASSSGATVTGAGTNAVAISGTPIEVENALLGLDVTENAAGVDTLTIKVSDAQDLASKTVVIALDAAGAPSVSASAETYGSIGVATSLGGVAVTEPGALSGETFTVQIVAYGATLAAGAGAAVTGTGTASLTIAGSLAGVNAALAGLTETSASPGQISFDLGVSDSLGGGSAVAVAGSGYATGTPALSAPTSLQLAAGVPSTVSGLALAETDALGNESFTITAKDASGLITASDAGGASVTGSGTTDLTITGGYLAVGAALATLAVSEAAAGSDTLEISASDSFGGQAAATSVSLATAGALTLAAPAAITVGASTAVAIAGFSVAEAAAPTGETFTAQLSDAGGLLSASAAGGAGESGAGTTTLVLTGSLAQVNAALATVTVDEGPATSDTLTLSVSDSLGGSAKSAGATIASVGVLTLTAPASASVATGAFSGVAGLSLAEAGAVSGETFTVQASDAVGVITANGAGVRGSDTTQVTMTGTLAQVDAALAGLAVSEPQGSADTLTLTATDSFGGTSRSAVSLLAAGAPRIAAPASAVVPISRAIAISGLQLAETNAGSSELYTLTATDTAGAITVGTSGGATVGGSGSLSLTLAGTLSQVNAALGTLEVTERQVGSDTLSLSASDSLGGTSPVTQVNLALAGAPVLSAPSQAVAEVGIESAIGLSLNEGDAVAGETFSVTLSGQRGVLSISAAGGAAITYGAGAAVVSGSLQQVHAALASVAVLESSGASDQLTVSATDSLGSQSSSVTVPISVAEPPSISAAGSLALVAGVAGGTKVIISEPGAVSGESFTVQLSASTATLSASGGGASIAGSGTSSLTVSGSLGQVNAALSDLGVGEASTASDTLHIAVLDSLGGSASTATSLVTSPGRPILQAPRRGRRQARPLPPPCRPCKRPFWSRRPRGSPRRASARTT
jgi:hypothetical protein